MLMTPSKFIFILSMMFGTILACSSSSWVMVWLGLEINLMCFTPILVSKLNPISMELTIKYFLVQAMASMILIMMAISSHYFANSSMLIDTQNIIVSISLAMKAGVAPLHFWFPQIMVFTNWFQAMLILTWQKIAPLVLLSFNLNFFTLSVIISSAIVGMLGGLNQTCLKKILTYSSIIHSSWMISVMYVSNFLWWLYFITYSILTISIVVPNSLLNLKNIHSINLMKIKIKTKMLIFINMLSLAGLPPFIGFSIKMISINAMIQYNTSITIMITLITSSLVAFYFYTRMVYTSLMINQNKYKLLSISPKMQHILTFSIIMSLMGNMLLSMLVLVS